MLFMVGVFSAGAAEKIIDRGDPPQVVVDEIVGQLIALIAVPLQPRPRSLELPPLSFLRYPQALPDWPD